MPLYEYECEEHGAFDAFRPIAEVNAPIDCPSCGRLAARVFTVPRTRTLAAHTRIGMERNEKSRHEPHVCGAGCSHGHAKPKAAASGAGASPKLEAYTGPRPWVVEHA